MTNGGVLSDPVAWPIKPVKAATPCVLAALLQWQLLQADTGTWREETYRSAYRHDIGAAADKLLDEIVWEADRTAKLTLLRAHGQLRRILRAIDGQDTI